MSSPTDLRPKQINLEGLAFGGDYNPEQWPEQTWHEDVRLMREAGVNVVTLPVFAWPLLEPEPGRYEFGWLDRVVDLLWDNGIAVDLATGTATPPAWLVRQHPEVLPWTRDGLPLEFGSRQAYCPSSPVFREYALRLTRAMASHFGGHEGVVLWHVSNEYGDHVPRCWCPVSAAHFRAWLRDKYEDVGTLNEAWGTTCWGQVYGSFDEVEPPRTATGPVNSAQRLDFERFSSDAMLELFGAEVAVLREVTPDTPVTTNFMSLFRELDYWDFAEAEDLVTDDAYPDPADPLAHVSAALNYGLMRSLKRDEHGPRPWLLLEQAASAVSWREVNAPKPPGMMRLHSLQAVAHGSDGVMYFQWRQARFGPERFHSAILGHRGTRSRSFQECRALGAELRRLRTVAGSRVVSRVALVVDWDAWWGLDAPDSLPSLRLDWLEQARAWHRALHVHGITVDTVRAAGPFDGYDLVVVPNLYVTTPEQASALTTFVARGGHLVVGPFSGAVDEFDRVHDGGAPGPLRDLLGIEVDEWWPVPEGQTQALAVEGVAADASAWAEWLEVAGGTEVIGRYSGGDLDDRPAVTRRRHGRGVATYVSADLDPSSLARVLGRAAEACGIPLRDFGPDVEVVTRYDGTAEHVFVLNHGASPASVEVRAGTDLLRGSPHQGGLLTLGARDAAVITLSPDSPNHLNPLSPKPIHEVNHP